MSTLKQRIFTNWHLARIMRLGIGIMLLIMGIQNKDWAMGLFSVFFLYQAVTDTGCCSSQECNTPAKCEAKGTVTNVPDQDIEYEEIK